MHTDSTLLPRAARARASWNVALDDCRLGAGGVAITYWMNRLQGLPGPTDYCVSLNAQGRVAPAAVHARATYEHPIYTLDALRARDELMALDGDAPHALRRRLPRRGLPRGRAALRLRRGGPRQAAAA